MMPINLILADDQLLFRKGLCALLNELRGINVIAEASHGKDLLTLLENPANIPDVILMDLNMPVLNGIDATEIIHKQYPHIKVIALSIYDEEAYITRIIEKGASGYLIKNAEPEEVEKAIREVVKSGFYFNEHILSAIKKKAVAGKKQLSFNAGQGIDISGREIDVLRLICKEYTASEIAAKLYISIRTVDGHRQKLLDKTGARNTAGLVLYAVKSQLVEIDF